MPRFAYSIASDLVAAFKLPFVSDASTDGMPAIACCGVSDPRALEKQGRASGARNR
jgi:hypothetical protein